MKATIGVMLPHMEENKKRTELKISGMSCAICATTIEKSILSLEGVSYAQVNLGTETATIEYDSTKLTLTDIEKAVTDAGYEVINKAVNLKIGGMTCAMCVKTIENALVRLDGIVSANINLGTEKAYVTYNPGIITVAEMKKAIEDAGYEYLGIEGGDTEDLEEIARENDLRKKRKRFIVGFAVGIPLMILMHLSVDLPFKMAYFMLVVSTPAFVYVSHPIFIAAYRALKNRNLNMDVMYSMGIGVAFIPDIMGFIGYTHSKLADRT